MSVKLIHGDCMDVMKDYPDNYFDLAIVDPPYGISAAKGGVGGSCRVNSYAKKSWDDEPPAPGYWDLLFKVCKKDRDWETIAKSK